MQILVYDRVMPYFLCCSTLRSKKGTLKLIPLENFQIEACTMAYAHDVDVTGRSRRDAKEA